MRMIQNLFLWWILEKKNKEGDSVDNEQVNEIKRYFGVVADGLRNEIRQMAEGVVNVDEKLERFRQEVREDFKELKSMIKFSYAELDQRIRLLEGTVSSLQNRMERLETLKS